MRINSLNINNFRNLRNIQVDFHPDINYIVGENNIGKSNLLDLVNTICNIRSFEAEDYLDQNQPISVIMSLQIRDDETGYIEVSAKGAECVNIMVTQEIKDARIEICNADRGDIFSSNELRRLNFFKYDAVRAPVQESVTGINASLRSHINFILKKYISNHEINEDNARIELLLEKYLVKTEMLSDLDIDIPPQKTIDILSRLIYLLGGNSVRMGEAGNGMQVTAMAALNIFTRIMDIYKSHSEDFNERIAVLPDGRKIMPLILAVDEPELHLHPYMQRTLLNYYKRLLGNMDTDFLDLLKYSFDLDGLDGQLMIVTQSTDALVDDHRNIIRFYRNKESKICAVSGKQMDIKKDIEKHLIMHFPEIKEAFYAKCTIIVEGETEYGCMKLFADKLGMNLDDYGICLVNARGESTIPKLEKLFRHFQIPSVVVFDSDVRNGHPVRENEFFTEGVCFEMDIVKTIIGMGKQGLIRDIVMQYDESALNRTQEKEFVKKPLKKIDYDMENYVPKKLNELDMSDADEVTIMYYAWFYKKKGIILGRLIGYSIDESCIPDTYKNAIKRSVEISMSGS